MGSIKTSLYTLYIRLLITAQACHKLNHNSGPYHSLHWMVDVEIYGFESDESSGNTPLKINMEHNHGGLEDHFPF